MDHFVSILHAILLNIGLTSIILIICYKSRKIFYLLKK